MTMNKLVSTIALAAASRRLRRVQRDAEPRKAMFHGVGQGHPVDPVSRDAAHAWFKSKTGFEY